MNIQVGMTDDDSWPILDFKKFPNEMISGLSLTQINDVIVHEPEPKYSDIGTT